MAEVAERLLHGQDSFLVLYKTVDGVNHPRSPVSDNTRKVIRQKVAICHLCHLTATFLPPFKKYTNNRKPARGKGLQRTFLFLPPLPPVFEGPFI